MLTVDLEKVKNHFQHLHYIANLIGFTGLKANLRASWLLENHCTKSIAADAITWGERGSGSEGARLCIMMLTRSSRFELCGHQISVIRFLRAGDNCKSNNKHLETLDFI